MSGDNGYTLILAHRFLKDMKRLSREDQLRVRRVLDDLQADPYKGRKVVATETGQYRWRVGELRIRYDIEDEKLIVSVLRVVRGDDAYRKF